ncbi:MAG: M23 family metallopeptidase [Acidobacteriota bacterium]|nr:M23 family metallopeptidase [Acidobacteriota bacterium]
MKKYACLALGLLCLRFDGFPRVREDLRTPSGLSVVLEYRSLQPGEAVLAALGDSPDVVRAEIRCLGRTYGLKAGEKDTEPFALIGLDLGLQPGTYSMDILIEKKGGRWEGIHKELVLVPREFPAKKLRVGQAYVTPPPELERRIANESELLKTVFGMVTPEWLAEGEFILPHDAQAYPNFGQRRIYNGVPRSIHSGIDIAVPWGQPVRASNSGRIAVAGGLYFAGKSVIIDHGLGVFTFYCHLSNILVKRGDLVRKGDVIAKSGNTGRSSGPHLHWAVKVQDSRIDPFSLLDLRFPEY